MNDYTVIGMMSGSSLDGLDLCLARFARSTGWSYHIKKTATVSIPDPLRERLSASHTMPAEALMVLDADYGCWIAEQINWFRKKEENILLAGIHGHTVFHNPEKQISLQIGNGALISSRTGLPVVDSFRIRDIYEGGQGAPLVPVGEHYLFGDYDAWINLGGIANISVKRADGSVLAWDICPCNQVFNFLAQRAGRAYDDGGKLARAGSKSGEWIKKWEALPYMQQEPPKSMSNQWVRENFLGELPENTADALHSFSHFVSGQISMALHEHLSPGARVLFTGGGAYNDFLLELIRKKSDKDYHLVKPEPSIIEYKEALIFGFLGLLRFLGQENVFASATGARKNTVAGTLHLP